jgi:hypothetical protein
MFSSIEIISISLLMFNMPGLVVGAVFAMVHSLSSICN